MGAIAESIKSAESKEAVQLSDALDYLQNQASEPVGGKSIDALHTAGLPTAGEESKRRLWKMVAGIGGGSVALGALLRLVRSAGEASRRRELIEDVDPAAGRPSTEVTIPVPGHKRASLEKAAIWPWLVAGAAAVPSATHAVGESLGSAWRKTKEKVGEGYEHLFEPTGTALTNPWTAPLGLLAGIAGTYGGYKLTDALISKLQKRRRARELERAQSSFERALSSQFSEKPACIIGAAVDGVAQAYVSGELEKQAATLPAPQADEDSSWWDNMRGAGGAATGGYLALLTLLATLGAAGGYSWVKKRETPRRKFEAAKELLLRRQMATPPTVTVDTGA